MNPFEALRLDPSASEEEAVKQAARLRQRAADEAELTAVRQAVQALTGRPEDRLLLESRLRAAHSQRFVMRMALSTSAHSPQKMHLPKSSRAARWPRVSGAICSRNPFTARCSAPSALCTPDAG